MKTCKDCGKKADRGNYCYACIKRKYRQNNPLRVAYQNLKDNAKRRNKPFDISFKYFKEFAIKTKYLNKKGKFRHSYHIDRINENLGYIEGNLQILQNVDNIKKYIQYKQRVNGKPEFEVITIKLALANAGDCPF